MAAAGTFVLTAIGWAVLSWTGVIGPGTSAPTAPPAPLTGAETPEGLAGVSAQPTILTIRLEADTATAVASDTRTSPTAEITTEQSRRGSPAGATSSQPTPAVASPRANIDLARQEPGVDAAWQSLSTDEERVGQLLLLGWAGNTGEQARDTIRELRPGGMVFIDNARTSAEAAGINLSLAQISAQYGLLPLLLGIDHEGGPVQRLADLPNPSSNGAFANGLPTEQQACERGLAHARQLRPLGFVMNLAPVLDVNTNPRNLVIGDRSYGGNPHVVAALGSAYTRGLQSGGVAAVGKHFPGHGATDVDSHVRLPILAQSLAELEQVHLVPFRQAIAPPTDIAAIMSAHVAVSAVDPPELPATLSNYVMTTLLRQQLGFGGLALTDDLGAMRAITDHYSPADSAVQAVLAGTDMLIISGTYTRQREARDALLAAIASGQLSRERVEGSVRRVLHLKARFGLLGNTVGMTGSCT